MSVYPWHKPMLERMRQLRSADRLPNAIALTCGVGWGLDNLLQHVALTLLEADTGLAMEEFAHPDFRWVVPDGAVLKIDQIRRINEFAVQTAQTAPRKVVALLNAHQLNPAAANALLKTLEEPPSDTHLLLATPSWGTLLPTIRSRCQRFESGQNQAAARAWLAKQGVEVTDALYVESGRAPLTVVQELSGDGIEVTGWLAEVARGDFGAAVDQALKQDVVALLSRWYRRLILHLQGQAIPGIGVHGRLVVEFADEVLDARRQLETTNGANPRLHLERLIVRWLKLSARAARG